MKWLITTPRGLALVIVSIVVVASVGWYWLYDPLPPPGSAEAFAVFQQRVNAGGLSWRAVRACKNAFPLGPCSPDMLRRLKENANNEVGFRHGGGTAYLLGKTMRSGDAAVSITVKGDPPMIYQHLVSVTGR